MERTITHLLDLFKYPQVLDDDELRTQISDVIKKLSLIVASNKTKPSLIGVSGMGHTDPKNHIIERAESPCPCGTCH